MGCGSSKARASTPVAGNEPRPSSNQNARSDSAPVNALQGESSLVYTEPYIRLAGAHMQKSQYWCKIAAEEGEGGEFYHWMLYKRIKRPWNASLFLTAQKYWICTTKIYLIRVLSRILLIGRRGVEWRRKLSLIMQLQGGGGIQREMDVPPLLLHKAAWKAIEVFWDLQLTVRTLVIATTIII